MRYSMEPWVEGGKWYPWDPEWGEEVFCGTLKGWGEDVFMEPWMDGGKRYSMEP